MGEIFIPVAYNLQPMLTTSPFTQPFAAPAELATKLLTHYSFDLNGYNASELVSCWQSEYPIHWLHLAVIEALYQGRYKAISVQQILTSWQRKGETTYHFNMEFERMICSKFPERLTSLSLPVLPPPKQEIRMEKSKNPRLLPAPVSYKYQINNNLQPTAEKRDSTLENLVPVPPSAQLTPNISQQPIIEEISPQPAPQLMLPATANHPPIGQFMPQKSARTESFTSKLKSLTSERLELVF
ncbi:MAG: hypothetical protein HCA25_07480 [Dolichospermum sp. DET50]|nr:hypothetical protein [Dolichospermum sp. DET66]MBS3032127.1 hypothetical protein [Dolichospermum sp. DET67]MBS3037331.1 hypothetical protein [Dolichospermum sp. DET50]QSX69320.1 MAG: hypothetical protein EZY12_06700 [Dolichospermum sp. DET69]